MYFRRKKQTALLLVSQNSTLAAAAVLGLRVGGAFASHSEQRGHYESTAVLLWGHVCHLLRLPGSINHDKLGR